MCLVSVFSMLMYCDCFVVCIVVVIVCVFVRAVFLVRV